MILLHGSDDASVDAKLIAAGAEFVALQEALASLEKASSSASRELGDLEREKRITAILNRMDEIVTHTNRESARSIEGLSAKALILLSFIDDEGDFVHTLAKQLCLDTLALADALRTVAA